MTDSSSRSRRIPPAAAYFRTGLLAVAAIFALAGQAQAQHVPGRDLNADPNAARNQYRAAVMQEYRLLMEDWRDAWIKGDAEKAARMYENDAYLFVADTAVIVGRAGIEGYLSQNLQNVVNIRTGLTDFIADDRLAYALGPFTYQFRQGGRVQNLSGTYMTVLVRTGRTWRIRSQVFVASEPAD